MSIFETYVKFLDTKIQAIPKGSTLSFILSSRDVTLATAASRSESFVSRKRKKKDWLTETSIRGSKQTIKAVLFKLTSYLRTKLSSTKRQELKMRNSTFLCTVIIIIVLSQCFQANAWRRRRRRRSPVIKPQPPKFVPAPRNPSGIPLCKGEIDVNQILQRGASGRKKRGVKRQVSVLETIYWPHLRGLITWARLARLPGEFCFLGHKRRFEST